MLFRSVVNTLKTAGMFNFVGDFNWRHNIAGRPELFWPVGILFLLGLAASIRSLFRKIFTKRRAENAMAYTFLFAWLAIAALPVVISNEGLPHSLRAILMIPPVFIFSAIGGLILYKFLEKRFKDGKMLQVTTIAFLALLVFEAYNTYFIDWAQNKETAGAFNQDYLDIAREINELPVAAPKIVVVNAKGVIVRGVPMPAQTVMFITGSFTQKGQKEKNIHYVTPDSLKGTSIPKSAVIFPLN